MAVDASGNVFVADNGNNAVKEIVAARRLHHRQRSSGQRIQLPHWRGGGRQRQRLRRRLGHNAVKEIVAPGGTTVKTLGCGFHQPCGVAVDGSGQRLRRRLGNYAVEEIVAEGGENSDRQRGQPSATRYLVFTFDSAGTLVADCRPRTPQGLDFTDGTAWTLGSATRNAIRRGDLHVAVTLRRRPRLRQARRCCWTASGNLLATGYGSRAAAWRWAAGDLRATSTPSGVYCPGRRAHWAADSASPSGVAVDGSGNVFVADTGNIGEGDCGGRRLHHVNTLGSGFNCPRRGGGRQRQRLRRRYRQQCGEGDCGGGRLHHVNTLGSGFNQPYGVAVDGSGNVFVADTSTMR